MKKHHRKKIGICLLVFVAFLITPVCATAIDFYPYDLYSYDGGLGPIASADFDDDGDLDLVVTSGRNGWRIAIFWNNGDGTFITEPTIYDSGGFPGSIIVADIDKDNYVDIIITNKEFMFCVAKT